MTGGEKQPWLPRVRMIWLFVLTTVMAVLLLVIRAADQGASLAFAAVFTGIFLLFLALVFSITFLAAYSFGRVEHTLAEPQVKLGSPFAQGQLPDQVIPPDPIETV